MFIIISDYEVVLFEQIADRDSESNLTEGDIREIDEKIKEGIYKHYREKNEADN